MKLQQFDGGVVTRLAPQLLNVNQGVVYENVDNSTGILTPIKTKLATDIALKANHIYFEAEATWIDAYVTTDFLEFQSKLYLTDRQTRPLKYSNGTYSFLGIERPAIAPTLTLVDYAEPLKDITTLNDTTGGNLPASDFDYLLFNVRNGVYSTPFKFTVYASTTNNTRANGIVAKLSISTLLSRNPITVYEAPVNRQINFSDILGKFQDEARLYRYYDGTWRLLYIFATKSATFSDTIFNIGSNSPLDESLVSKFEGTYQYVYTFYNANDGTESAPSPISIELTTQSGRIQVSMPSTSADPQVTHKRLYRLGGDITQFTLVTELPASTTEYIDNLSDLELEGSLLESDNYYEAPAGLKYLSEAYAMLFGAIGSSLRFTPIGKPNAWPPEYELQFDSDITGLGPVANGLLVFTRTKTYIVTGTGPLSLAQQTLRGDQGCIAFESIAEAYAGTLIWASEDGLCTSSGNNVQSLTKGALGKIKLTPVSSVVHDEIYYCHNADGSILAFDYRFNSILKWLNLGTQSLVVGNNTLYGYYNGILYTLFEGSINAKLKYKSPLLIEGSFSEAKTYKKVYIRSEGDIILNIIIDNEIVASFNLTGTKTHQLQVPQQLQRGYSIQFEIEGTGVIHELEYTAERRQNG